MSDEVWKTLIEAVTVVLIIAWLYGWIAVIILIMYDLTHKS